MFDTKIAIVVREDLAMWQKLNVTAFLSTGIASQSPEVIGEPYRDKAGNVFNGPGLEWLPAGLYSLRSIPVIKSLYPGWEQKGLAEDVEAGRYFLPGAPRGERETIVTSPLNAEPQYLLQIPRPSSWHVWGAVFTAGFFLILTIQAYLASVISGILAVYCILKWCWKLDRPDRREGGAAVVDVGAGVRLPTYVSGPTSHGWWAMVITLIVAGMVAFSVAGFNLQNVAIIAGALSVGVGFGLQSIVNNFVSGLILLAERPIKAGDWIVVGADQGYVKRINVRSTEIETFDRSTVIVPNSDLISGVVKNWMHNDNSGRVIVDVRVPFQSDPDQVHDLLLEVAQSHPNVLAYPEAKVYLSNFGESALEFQLFCYLGNVDYMLSAKSELRFAVFRTLRENGIEIPYTRRDVHINDRAADRPAPAGAPHEADPPSREAISDAPDGDGAEI